jgi:hypothetical protein
MGLYPACAYPASWFVVFACSLTDPGRLSRVEVVPSCGSEGNPSTVGNSGSL